MVERPAVRPPGGGTRGRSARGNAMPNRPFVHLHCHSHYSLLDGASKIPALVERAKELGMNALAMTDHGNLYGAIEFLREAKAAGFNPIVGLEAYVAPGRRTERTTGGAAGNEHAFHLTLLAKNADGVPEPDQALVAWRSSKASTTSRGSTRRCSSATPRGSSASRAAPRPSSRTTSCTARRPRPSGSAPGFRRSSARRTSSSRSRTTASTSSSDCAEGRSTSRGGWACRWWPPATPTT